MIRRKEIIPLISSIGVSLGTHVLPLVKSEPHLKEDKTMKKRFLITAILVLMLVAQGGLMPKAGQAQQEQMPQFLFVQNAKGVVFDKGTISLKGVSPATLYFSDRPMRIAGHFTTEEFVQMWGQGKDSFASDPPNATLSIFQEDRDKLIDVVVKLSHPKLEGDDLTYHVAIIEGQMPAKGGICSLFIDIIGLPFTPLSFAGVARRTAYRSAVWGTAAAVAAHPWVYPYPYPYYHYPSTIIVKETAPPPPPTIVIRETPAPAPAVPSLQVAEQKLKDLKALFDQGLISQSDYAAKRKQILESF
jgi:hypothetical protein